MAVAGIQSESVIMFDSSFRMESQSPEPSHCDEQSRPSTRASSLLQMWRELEGESIVNQPYSRTGLKIHRQRSDRSSPETEDSVITYLSDGPESVNGNETLEANDVQNVCDNYSPRSGGSVNEMEDSNSVISEQSADLGQVERQRVRKVFREWMNNGSESHVSGMNHRSRVHCLGEIERERVRSIMDWVQVNSEQRGNCDSPRDEGASEIGPQIKLARDGLLVNCGELPERKAIRKLCGRQALLDLLARAQREKESELQELLDHKPVSNFTHRNRIQSLLKGRFLRNEIMTQKERLNSRAASELGLLRQRHAVSDLREGFLSRSVNSGHGSSANSESGDTSCEEDGDYHEKNQLNEMLEVSEGIHDLFEPSEEERERGSSQFDATGNTNEQHSAVQAVESPVQLLIDGCQELEPVRNIDCICNRHIIENNANALVQETSESDANVLGHMVAHELPCARDETQTEVSNVHLAGSPVEDLEVDGVQDIDGHETLAQVEEQQESALDHEDWQELTLESNDWTNANEESIARTWQENVPSQWDQERPDDELREDHDMHEEHEDWHENGLQEAIDSWLDGPSGQEVGSLGRVDTFYFPEDDNAHNVELRELLSRRLVSGLLQSGFRASLDQLIQSYVERQGNTSMDWDPDETPSSPAFNEQDEDQQNGDQIQDSEQYLSADGVFPTDESSQPLLNRDAQPANWSRNSSHHQLGIEWEVINELRVDMVRLQQCMNSMQRMLEACMDMQLELQRSVRQEVSAALNRPAVATDAGKDDPPKVPKWEFVRKGICCMCTEHNIDSLLYRCGHMCTCSGCAENLVHRKDKCPMCGAPVVEMVRAYSIQ